MKITIHFSSYLPPFFLERKVIQTKFVEKITTHTVHAYSLTSFPKVVKSVKKCGIIRYSSTDHR